MMDVRGFLIDIRRLDFYVGKKNTSKGKSTEEGQWEKKEDDDNIAKVT